MRLPQEDTDRYDVAINTASDLFLAVFPTYTFWSLSLKLRVKISLVVLMGFGLVCVFSRSMTSILSQIANYNTQSHGGLGHANRQPGFCR